MLSAVLERKWVIPALMAIAGALAALLLTMTSGPPATHAGITLCETGTSGDDRFDGTEDPDCYDGGEGDDKIKGRAGGDLLIGGPDDDRVDGGEGGDELAGDDPGNGPPPGDRRRGEEFDGEDDVRGREGGDLLVGGGCDDQLNGGPGGDELHDEGSNLNCFSQGQSSRGEDAGDKDKLRGGLGDDSLDADDGDDQDLLKGGDGIDECIGDPGDDQVSCENVVRRR